MNKVVKYSFSIVISLALLTQLTFITLSFFGMHHALTRIGKEILGITWY